MKQAQVSVIKQVFGNVYNTIWYEFHKNLCNMKMIVKFFVSHDQKHTQKMAYFNVKLSMINKKSHFKCSAFLLHNVTSSYVTQFMCNTE